MVSKKAYRVTGSFKASRWVIQKFVVEVAARNKEDAIHLIYSQMGSRHRMKRRFIRITDITPLEKDKITNPVVDALCAEDC
jgi:large subunit ribosomal protein LX